MGRRHPRFFTDPRFSEPFIPSPALTPTPHGSHAVASTNSLTRPLAQTPVFTATSPFASSSHPPFPPFLCWHRIAPTPPFPLVRAPFQRHIDVTLACCAFSGTLANPRENADQRYTHHLHLAVQSGPVMECTSILVTWPNSLYWYWSREKRNR